MLAQRAVADSLRWTRAVEDQSAPISEEITSELGRSIYIVRRAQLGSTQPPLKMIARCGLARSESVVYTLLARILHHHPVSRLTSSWMI